MIVDSAAYADGRRVADVPIDDISEWVRRDGSFVWVGTYEPDEALLRKLQEEFGLHDLAVEDAHRAHQRPKIEEFGDSLFVVLRTAHWKPATRELDIGETHVFVGPHYVLSVRHGVAPSYAAVRARTETTPELLRLGPGFALYAILDFVVDNYFPVVDALEEEVEALELAIFDGGAQRDATTRIYQLKRELMRLKRTVAPVLEVCNRLVRFDRGSIVPPETVPYFRDVWDHVVRVNESVDALRELLSGALDANLALAGIRQNDVMKQLAGWAAMVAAPTLLAGVWGMNFEFMPELRQPWGYPAALTLMASVAGTLYWRFKRAGWL